MGRYSVELTQKAYNDLDEIYDHIKNELHNEGAAIELIGEIENAILNLGEFPKLYSSVEDINLKNKGYRKIIVKNYIIFYLVNDEEEKATIMHVMYGRRDYEKLI